MTLKFEHYNLVNLEVDEMVDVATLGMICLDIPSGSESIADQGCLANADPTEYIVGGGPANVVTKLDVLGFTTSLCAAVGDDISGYIIQKLMSEGANFSKCTPNLVVKKGAATSTSLVLQVHGEDRRFQHHVGVNGKFGLKDIVKSKIMKAKACYVGYPTLLPDFIVDSGRALADFLSELLQAGVITIVDLSMVGKDSEAYKLDWNEILANILPYTSIFVPSIGEVRLLLNHDQPTNLGFIEESLNFTEKFLDFGCEVAGLKLGKKGLYLRTGSSVCLPTCCNSEWQNIQLFAVPYANYCPEDELCALGSGDTAVATLIGSILAGKGPEKALQYANLAATHIVSRRRMPTSAEMDEEIAAGLSLLHEKIPAVFLPTNVTGVYRR